jgi:Holliday junction DNA helicase RuvA
MIAFLRGQVLAVQSESAIIDVHGVGYEIQGNLETLGYLQEFVGAPKEVHLWIHTHVREDAFLLFGFLTSQDKDFFLSLLKVNGVGPKMAMNIMSGANTEQVVTMIENEDVKALSKLPKVGKKTAEQMILTLKGKLVLAGPRKTVEKSATDRAYEQLSSALLNLGFRNVDVDEAISKLPKDLSLEEGIRQSLSLLTNL